MESWLLNESKGGRPGEVCVVKHFRDKRTLGALPRRFPELYRLSHVSCLQPGCFAHGSNPIRQLNLEDLVDVLSEGSNFLVITEVFSQTTLHTLHQEEPLSAEEVGFVMGQTFAALEYVHDHGWTHGNLDPRSIHVMSRKHLWIKLTDTALSDYVDLGKPDGYHSIYASQNVPKVDQSPADVWSAGVVALELLRPDGLPHRNTYKPFRWAQGLESLAKDMHAKSANEATAFITNVLTYDFSERPKAKEVLEDPWILRNRGESFVNNSNFNVPTPQVSRHTSAEPSHGFSRHGSATPSNWSIDGDAPLKSRHPSVAPSCRSNMQDPTAPSKSAEFGEYAPGSGHTSVGPFRHSSRHGSLTSARNTIGGFNTQRYDPTSRVPSRTPSRQSSTDPILRAIIKSRPYPGDDYNDFDSDHETSNSRSSRFTANPLAREPRTPTPYESEDRSDMPDRPGSSNPQPRSSGGVNTRTVDNESGSTISRSSRYTAANPPSRTSHASTETESDDVDQPSSLRSHSRRDGNDSPVSDRVMGTTEQLHRQRDAEIEEDDGEDTETGGRRGSATKKPRRVVSVPPLAMKLRSRDKDRR